MSSSMAIWAALLTLYLVWGSTYLFIRIAIETLPPFLMTAIRFVTAGAFLYLVTIALARRSGSPFPRAGRREWRDSIIVGAALMVGGMGLVAWGEQTVPSGIAALLIALLPLWMAILGRVFFDERLPWLVVGGIVLGFGGIAVLAWPTAGAEGLDPAGLAALLVSPVSWAAGSLFAAHRARLPAHPLLATSMQMLAGGVLLGVVATALGEPVGFSPSSVSASSWVALGYLTVVGSIVAFSAYVWLLRAAPVSLISTYAYVNPVVAVALGAVVLGEAITARELAAGAIIVAAVAVIVTARGRMRRVTPPCEDVPATPEPTPRPTGERADRRPGPLRPAPEPSRAAPDG